MVFRWALPATALLCVAALLLTGKLLSDTARGPDIPLPAVHVGIVDPYSAAELEEYRRFRDALFRNDFVTLEAIADSDDGFLAYRAALGLARHPELDPERRLKHFEQVLELAIDEPLARAERRALQLEIGRLTEAAGRIPDAIAAFEEALPEEEAIEALKRLQENPYRRSNAFLRARLYREALDALGKLTAPSIEAPAYRALGENKAALDAYRRWLGEQPENLDARYGLAWTYYRLGDLDTAEALFGDLPGASALYGRALIRSRQGDIDGAVDLLGRSGDADYLWLATGLLEAEDRYAEVIPLYLELAGGSSRYADDAAYRAFVLADRLGDVTSASRAWSLIPSASFFGLKVGKPLPQPTRSTLPERQPEVLALANALMQAQDPEAAIGELLFALRKTRDEATVVALAELLQSYGEFRQSQRAAQRHLDAGSRELRTWRLAYPQAYPESVLRETARHGIEPELVWAIMRQESAFYPAAVSSANAIGLMQVIPSTWNWLAELQGESPADPFEPTANIRYGSYYLAWLLDYLYGDLELVVSSYNRGQGYIKRLYEGPLVNRDKDELYREIDALETREYLQRVMVNYEVYKTLYP